MADYLGDFELNRTWTAMDRTNNALLRVRGCAPIVRRTPSWWSKVTSKRARRLTKKRPKSSDGGCAVSAACQSVPVHSPRTMPRTHLVLTLHVSHAHSRPWVRAYRAAHAIMVVKGDKQEGTQADKKEAKKL